MTGRTRKIAGSAAWKEERTAGLVAQALTAGFRGLDTANQRKHYHEADVGRALLAALARGTVRREDVFVQTKFTFLAAQDRRVPYDPAAPITQQVAQSFQSSLSHVRGFQEPRSGHLPAAPESCRVRRGRDAAGPRCARRATSCAGWQDGTPTAGLVVNRMTPTLPRA
jgi:hypothetical protein